MRSQDVILEIKKKRLNNQTYNVLASNNTRDAKKIQLKLWAHRFPSRAKDRQATQSNYQFQFVDGFSCLV